MKDCEDHLPQSLDVFCKNKNMRDVSFCVSMEILHKDLVFFQEQFSKFKVFHTFLGLKAVRGFYVVVKDTYISSYLYLLRKYSDVSIDPKTDSTTFLMRQTGRIMTGKSQPLLTLASCDCLS